MSDDKENDTKRDSKEQSNEIETGPHKKCIEVNNEISGKDVPPNDFKNDTKSVEQQLIHSKSNGVMADGPVNGVSEAESATSVEGCVEQQVSPSLEKLLLGPVKSTDSDEVSALDGKSSKRRKNDVLDDDSSSESEEYGLNDNGKRWSAFRIRFEKCLGKLLKVTKDDIKQRPFDELCKMLVQPTALYRERKRFYFASRMPKESDEEYMQRLTDLASTCQFGKRTDLTISDTFIMSFMKKSMYRMSKSKSPWTGLQQEIDTKKALEIAQNHDDGDDMQSYLDQLCGRGRGNSKKIPPHLAELIRNEIMEKDLSVDWDDIAGLDVPKSVIIESIVWPMLRPDIFTGLRKLPKAMLLFGPPGTGKTMMAKCIAAQSKSTFFYVSASTIASKFHGESEQLVRALFTVAAEHQPAVIFFDEVDSLLTQRKKRDNEVSRRIKTEFMIQLDGAATKDDTRVLFIGATNRPQDLDEAARRRFVKRLYIPLPDLPARQQLLNILLKNHHSNLTDNNVNEIAAMTNEFSGADIKWLCQDAAMEPLRSIPGDGIKDIDVQNIRPLEMMDFSKSLKRIRPSVASADLTAMVEWDGLYGSHSERKCFNDNHFMYS